MTRLKLVFLVTCLSAWFSAVLVAHAAESERPAVTIPGQISVVILEPEVQADLPADERKALSAQLDTLLANALAGQKEFVAVDRQLLDKVLSERTSAATGMWKLVPSEVAEPLRPFCAAGVLICPVITSEKPAKGSAAVPPAVISIEAVAAQTGQLLAAVCLSGSAKDATWLTGPQTARQIEAFWQELGRNAREAMARPLVEIAASDAPGTSNRLQWLADDLQDSLRAAVGPELGVGLLTPRLPLLTKEERLLRVMGLSAAGPHDKVAALSPAPNFRLTATVTEEATNGKTFAETPFMLRLLLSAGPKEIASTEIAGTVGTEEKARAEAVRCMREQLAVVAGGKAALDVEASQLQAQEELRAAEQLAAVQYAQDSLLEHERRGRLLQHALRAAHLDPTSEPAAYLVLQNLESIYAELGSAAIMAAQGHPAALAKAYAATRARDDRLIAECRRYLALFGSRVVPHHVEVLSDLALAGFHVVEVTHPERRGTTAAWTAPPDVEQYEYESIFARNEIELGVRGLKDKRYAISNALQAAPGHLLLGLIPNIPDSKLDEEYAFWRKIWQENFENLRGVDVKPWTAIEAAFEARRRNPQGVRQTLQALADRYPHADTRIWSLMFDDIIPLYLHAAGDKEWATWQPKWPATPEAITAKPEDVRRFKEAFFAPPLDSSSEDRQYPLLPTTGKLVFAPEVLLEAGKGRYGFPYPLIQPLLVAGDDMWFITPGQWCADNDELRAMLFVAPLAQVAGPEAELHAETKAVAWPAQGESGSAKETRITVTCWQTSDGGKAVWFGTTGHGLARFMKDGGTWRGQWLTSRDGLPAGRVTKLTTADDGRAVLVDGLGPADVKKQRCEPWRVAVSADGATVRIPDQAGDPLMARPGKMMLTTAQPGQKTEVRHWFVQYCNYGFYSIYGQFAYYEHCWQLWELDARNGKPRGTALGQGVDSAAIHGNDEYASQKSPLAGLRIPATAGECFWLGCHSQALSSHEGEYGEATHVLIYRPAPFDEKNWADQDCWIGPFRSPAGAADFVFDIFNDGHNRIWITTGAGIYRVDPERVVSDGLPHGLSTAEWRRQYQERRSQAPLTIRIRQLVADGKAAEAAALADKRLAALGRLGADSPVEQRREWGVLQCLRAMAQTTLPETKAQAVETYEQIITTTWADPMARIAALRSQFWLLSTLQRWGEVVTAFDRIARLSPKDTMRYARGNRSDKLPPMFPSEPNSAWEPDRVVAEAKAKLKAKAAVETRSKSDTTPASAVPVQNK